jgi:hypothetical protein
MITQLRIGGQARVLEVVTALVRRARGANRNSFQRNALRAE